MANIEQVLRLIGKDVIDDVELYINDAKSRDYLNFNSEEEINLFFKGFMKDVYNNHSYDEIDNIRYYTGISFNSINSLLRGYWDYDKNGLLTEEKKEEIIEISSEIEESLINMPNLNSNIKAYRGVDINYFRDYDIHSLDDLNKLVNQYYFDSGFISTSLLQETSFFDKDLEYHDKCNIEIEYLIPEECSEAIPLINDDLSYSKSQNEFLICKSSLSKIVDVNVDSDENKAYISMLYIPQKIRNKDLNKERNSIKK